jgi:hypothetical protein
MLTIPRPFHCSIKPLAKPLDKSNFAEAKSLNVNIRKDLSLFVTEENLRSIEVEIEEATNSPITLGKPFDRRSGSAGFAT